MTPTQQNEPTRYFLFQLRPFKAGRPWPPVFRVRADKICESSDPIRLFIGDKMVPAIRDPISAWWIEEESAGE